MRLAFFGTPAFAVPTLDALHAAGHELALVVSQPDRPAGRGNVVARTPVAERALALGLPLAQPVALRSGPFPERFAQLKLDVAVVIAYGRILPVPLLQAPRLGCVNVHASLLPRWRGAAPIQRAVLAGDAVSGVCTQRMEEGLDTGPLYGWKELRLDPRETSATLHDRLSLLAAELAVETLDGLGGKEPVAQATEGVCWADKIEKGEGRVDWADDAIAIDRRIRAMTPWPGGFVDGPDGPIKLLEAVPVAGVGAPGEILDVEPLIVACGGGGLLVARMQLPGRRAVSGAEAARGLRLAKGDRFPGVR